MIRLAVVGTGRLASALARTFRLTIVSVTGRDPVKTAGVAALTAEATASDSLPDANQFNVLWLATNDRAIPDVVQELVGKRSDWKGTTILHSSGGTSVEALRPFVDKGAAAVALHPNLSLTGDSPIPPHAFWSLSSRGFTDGDDERFAMELLALIQPRLIRVDEQFRALYHAAASTAANYPVALFAMAAELYRRAGVVPADAREIVHDFMIRCIDKVFAEGEDSALTGPLVRGDTDIVEAQKQAVDRFAPEFAESFRRLVQLTELFVK